MEQVFQSQDEMMEKIMIGWERDLGCSMVPAAVAVISIIIWCLT